MVTDGAAGANSKPVNQEYAGSWAADLRHRLDAMDFMNQAMSLAGTLLLCAFPFFLILAAVSGRSAVTGIARHLNLNQTAAADVGDLFASSTATSAAVTGLAWASFIFCGICAAASIQALYERVFELPSRGARDMVRQLIWLGLLAGYLFVAGLVGPWVRHGGLVLAVIVGLVTITGVWWGTSRFLLGGRISWRRLFPCAVATGVFFVGMLLVFSFTFSGMVISGAQRYGPIGTVFALMAWMIAIGVVIILGSAVGLMWQDRRAASGKVRRAQ